MFAFGGEKPEIVNEEVLLEGGGLSLELFEDVRPMMTNCYGCSIYLFADSTFDSLVSDAFVLVITSYVLELEVVC